MSNRIFPLLSMIGGLMALIGVAVYITGWRPAPYIYTIGAALFTIALINLPHANASVSLRRLHVQQVIGSLFLVAAGGMMFLMHRNEWIVAFAIGTFILLYTSFRIPQEEKKTNK